MRWLQSDSFFMSGTVADPDPTIKSHKTRNKSNKLNRHFLKNLHFKKHLKSLNKKINKYIWISKKQIVNKKFKKEGKFTTGTYRI